MQQAMEKTRAMIDHLFEVDRILEKHHYRESRLIPILQEVQAAYSYLSKDMIGYVATGLGLPPSRVYGVATFYAHFSMESKGKHVIRLCDGTACHVKKSHGILHALYARLKLDADKRTTDDLLFTVETVSCLGACGLAPVMLINEQVYGQVTPDQAVELVEKLIAEAAAGNQTGVK